MSWEPCNYALNSEKEVDEWLEAMRKANPGSKFYARRRNRTRWVGLVDAGPEPREWEKPRISEEKLIEHDSGAYGMNRAVTWVANTGRSVTRMGPWRGPLSEFWKQVRDGVFIRP